MNSGIKSIFVVRFFAIFLVASLISACGGGGGGATPGGGGNASPTVNAGSNQTVTAGSTVQLSGSGNDAEGSVTFAWTQLSGTTVILSDVTIANPSFIAPVAASVIVLQLVVTDSDGVSVSGTVTITVTSVNTAGFTIGGTISGNSTPVTLSLNGIQETFTGPSFTFANRVAENDLYAVQFISTPNDQVCVASNNGGIATRDIINIVVTCSSPITLLRYNDAEITGALTVGDFNGDTFSDLAFSIRTLPGYPSGANQDIFRFLYGAGDGTFQRFIDIPVIGSVGSVKRGHNVVTTDLNNDAVDDFAYSNSGGLQAFIGDNSAAPTSYFISSEYAGAPLYSFDVDGNGYDDFISIIQGGSISNLFSLYRNNGDGSFGTVERIGVKADLGEFGLPLNFTVSDFNNDGINDILSIGTHGSTNNEQLALAFFAGNGDGTFDNPLGLDLLGTELFLGEFVFEDASKEITFGDFDGDGDQDIAITSTTSYLQILTNDGTGRFTAGQRVTVGTKPIHIQAVDMNNDSILDLVSVNDTSRTAVISFGVGDGTFGDSSSSPGSWINIQFDGQVDLRDMSLTDLNQDGYMDIVVAEDGTNPSDSGRGSVQIIFSPGAN